MEGNRVGKSNRQMLMEWIENNIEPRQWFSLEAVKFSGLKGDLNRDLIALAVTDRALDMKVCHGAEITCSYRRTPKKDDERQMTIVDAAKKADKKISAYRLACKQVRDLVKTYSPDSEFTSMQIARRLGMKEQGDKNHVSRALLKYYRAGFLCREKVGKMGYDGKPRRHYIYYFPTAKTPSEKRKEEMPKPIKREEWNFLRGPGLKSYIKINKQRILASPKRAQLELEGKWLRIFPNRRYPLSPVPIRASAPATAPLPPKRDTPKKKKRSFWARVKYVFTG